MALFPLFCLPHLVQGVALALAASNAEIAAESVAVNTRDALSLFAFETKVAMALSIEREVHWPPMSSPVYHTTFFILIFLIFPPYFAQRDALTLATSNAETALLRSIDREVQLG